MLRLTSVAVAKLILLFYLLSIGYWAISLTVGCSFLINVILLYKVKELEKTSIVSFWLIILFPVTIIMGFILLGGISKKKV